MNKPGKTLSLADLLQLVQEESHKCIRCGECRTVCPVFKENVTERYTARGKIVIAEELAKGNLEFTGHVREAFDNCLLCTGCVSQCSSGARADKVVMAVRQVFADKKGLNPVKKILGMALSQSGKVLDVESRIGAYVQPLLFKDVPEDSGMYRRFAMPMVDKKQYVPTVAKKSFRNSYLPSQLADNQGSKKKVIFFTGCMSNYAMTEIAESTVKILNAAGISVEVPKSQGCCGMPMLASGDFSPAGKQMERNLKALLNGYDKDVPIVTACASCGHMLKHGYKELMGRYPSMAEKIQNLADRSKDITEYLLENVGEDKLRSILGDHFPETVTYHDPCHLRKAQGLSKEPRILLQLIPGINFKEMHSPEACCGMGGTYCITNMKLSKSIESKKIEDVNSTKADCVSTACPGCILQLRDGLRRSGQRETSVKHVIQLLAESL